MEWLSSPEAWIALASLTAIEIVLGIDNIVFISILAGRLPPAQRDKARVVGLALAMVTRILLLLSLTWLLGLTRPLFEILDHVVSSRDLILISGGLFLLAKSTLEIHQQLEGGEERVSPAAPKTFMSVIIQIALLDIIFSLDSVITAIGLAKRIPVMVIAIVVAVIMMMIMARSIGSFVDRHPTIRMLALSFLILIGVALIGDGLQFHIPKGYIYFAMAFSLGVEVLNMKLRRRGVEPVQLHKAYKEAASSESGKPEAGSSADM